MDPAALWCNHARRAVWTCLYRGQPTALSFLSMDCECPWLNLNMVLHTCPWWFQAKVMFFGEFLLSIRLNASFCFVWWPSAFESRARSCNLMLNTPLIFSFSLSLNSSACTPAALWSELDSIQLLTSVPSQWPGFIFWQLVWSPQKHRMAVSTTAAESRITHLSSIIVDMYLISLESSFLRTSTVLNLVHLKVSFVKLYFVIAS